MDSTISNLYWQVESPKSNQLLHRLCNGYVFPRAWSQSVVLVLEQLDKMAGLLFVVLVGWDESKKFHLQLLSETYF